MRAGGSGSLHIDDGARWRDHFDRPERALVQGRLRVKHRLNRDQHPGGGDRSRRVHRERDLRGGAAEIGDHAITLDRERQGQKQRLETATHEGLEIVFVIASAVRYRGNGSAHARLGPIEVKANGFEQRIHAVAGANFMDAFLRHPASGQACLKVAEALVRYAHVGQQKLERCLIDLASLENLQWWDANALLIDLRCLARHAARHHAADIGPVRAHGGKEDEASVTEDRIDDGDVIEVGAAGVGIVEENDVAFLERCAELRHGGAHRPRHRHDMRADIFRLGDDLAVRRKQATGEILGVIDGDRARRAADRGAHFPHGGNQRLR